MAGRHSLIPFEGSTDDFALLCPDNGPAATGQGSNDWHCVKCGVLLLARLYERQVLDVLARCYDCGSVGALPTREPGEPLVGRPVLLPPGRYRLSSQVRIDGDHVMLVGPQALNGYLRETGLNQVSSAGLDPQPPTEISASGLRVLAAEAAALLNERFSHFKAADARGQSSPTPPADRHRLIELIDQMEIAAARLDSGGGVVDADALSELSTCVALFHRWQYHPAYPHLLKTLSDGQEVQHTIMVLAAASYLADAGNPVGIVFQHGNGRIPDLWVTPNLIERLNLEVKTPKELRGPRATVLTDAAAEKLLTGLLKKAASTSGGQLDQRQSGVLAIGGFHLGPSFSVLVRAATRVLAAQASRKRHLAAFLLMNLTYQTTQVVDGAGNSAGPTTFQPMLQRELVRHPGYRGSLEIHSDVAPWTSLGSLS